MAILGQFHEQGGAASVEASFIVNGGFQYLISSEHGQISGDVSSLTVSDRLGNIPRRIVTVEGHVFSTVDNDGVDSVFKPIKQRKPLGSFVHRLEQNVAMALIGLVVTVLFAYGVFRYGVPAAAHTLAEVLPVKTNEVIGHNSLSLLDNMVFEASELSGEAQQEVSHYFYQDLLPQLKQHVSLELDYTLHFRSWPSERYEQGVPNAFALPGGDIILTDQFVRLAESNDELGAVLLHEIGHIKHRHSLKTVIRAGLYSGLVAAMLGDLNALGDLGVGVASLLAQSQYSREYEREADQFSFEYMLLLDIDPMAFVKLFDAMETYMALAQQQQPDAEQDESGDETETPAWVDYLATHPPTAERVAEAQRYGVCFEQGLSQCESSISTE